MAVCKGALRVGVTAGETGGDDALGRGATREEDTVTGPGSERVDLTGTQPSPTCTSLELWMALSFAASNFFMLAIQTSETGMSKRANTS